MGERDADCGARMLLMCLVWSGATAACGISCRFESSQCSLASFGLREGCQLQTCSAVVFPQTALKLEVTEHEEEVSVNEA